MQSETKICVYALMFIFFACFCVISLFDSKVDKKSSRSISILFCFCMLHSVIGMCSEYIDMTRGNYILQYICCTLYPVVGYFELFFYGKYYIETCNAKQDAIKKISFFNTIILIINLLGTFITLPTGMLFTISKDCVYERGPLFFMSYAFTFAEMMALDVFTITVLKDVKKAVGYLCFCMFPIIASVLMIFTPLSSVFNDVAALISCIVLYAFVYVEEKNELVRNKAKLSEYKVDIMMSQIGPHFIYNTLSTISALCTIDPEKAQKLTDDFSDYLRENLDFGSTKKLSSFNDELNHTNKYLEIEKVRFGSRLNVEYDIDASDFFMPTLSLQPIVENAVKHGIMKKPEGGTVKISTKETDECFVVTVSDDGVGFDVENFVPQKGHYGLSTVKERLKMLLHGEMKIESRINAGTTITIFIGKEEA